MFKAFRICKIIFSGKGWSGNGYLIVASNFQFYFLWFNNMNYSNDILKNVFSNIIWLVHNFLFLKVTDTKKLQPSKNLVLLFKVFDYILLRRKQMFFHLWIWYSLFSMLGKNQCKNNFLLPFCQSYTMADNSKKIKKFRGMMPIWTSTTL